MGDKNLNQTQRSFWDTFLDGAILALTENKRREKVLAQIITESLSNSKEQKSNSKIGKEILSDAVKSEAGSANEMKKYDKLLDEHELVKKKREMRTKSKL